MTSLPSPLPSELVDELLSADLDGELDGAASDLGVSVDELRDSLASTPGTDARRAELARARAVSVAESTPVDDLERERLVRATRVGASVPSRTSRLALIAGAVASAAAIIFVLVLVSGGSSKNGSADSTVTADAALGNGGAPTVAAARRLPDFGALSSDAELRASVRSAVPVDRGDTGKNAAVPTTIPVSVESSGSQDSGQATTSLAPPDPTRDAAATGCLDGLPGRPDGTRAELLGFAVYQGEAVAVARAVAGDQVVIWAYATNGCRVVITASDAAP